MSYDSILLVSFGGPEGPDEVMPFLERVVAGRGVPRERLLAVAEHYYAMGGVSPIHARTRELLAALEEELSAHGPSLPVFWGNRFAAPFLVDTLTAMRDDGRRHALAVLTSAYSSWSSCRAYLSELEAARAAVPGAPRIDKVRPYFNHPGFIETWVERLRDARAGLGARGADARVLFSAHSIPMAMAAGCDYELQLREVARLVAEGAGVREHELVYQSRSGPPQVPWLEPDVLDALRALARRARGAAVVVAPIGFVADHMEVVWDLDHEARALSEELGLTYTRASAPNAHPRFVRMLRELIGERLEEAGPRLSVGTLGPRPDRCAPDCCASGRPAPRRAEP